MQCVNAGTLSSSSDWHVVHAHHDQANYFKRKHLVEGLLTVSEGESRIIMVRSMAAGRQTWHWNSS